MTVPNVMHSLIGKSEVQTYFAKKLFVTRLPQYIN